MPLRNRNRNTIPNFRNVSGAGFTGLLDEYGGAAAAYSVRRLSSTYEGELIEVRRSSDNTTQDIGYDSNGDLDTASLLLFVGAGDGFVRTWYDQSSNANNATQTTAASQPRIVINGSLVTENGEAAVSFDGINDNFKMTSSTTITNNISSFAVCQIVSETDFNFIYDTVGSNKRIRLGLWSTNHYFSDNGDAALAQSSVLSDGLRHLFFARHTSSNASISVDNESLISSVSASFSSGFTELVIGSRDNEVDHWLDGKIQEFIIYPSDQSSNRTAIESNINSYFSIY